MKQKTRAMNFLKAIFEDGVDCILTPGKLPSEITNTENRQRLYCVLCLQVNFAKFFVCR